MFTRLAVLASSGLLPGAAVAAEAVANEVVCSIPIGPEGVSYWGERMPEVQPWGPAALAVAPDGTFWVADTAKDRLLHYSQSCQRLGIIELQDVRGISDLEVGGAGIFAFDRTAQEPTVLHLSLSGAEYARYQVGQDATGLRLGEGGELLVERHLGTTFDQLLDREGKRAHVSLPGLLHQGTVYTSSPADLSQAKAHTGALAMGDRTVEVTVPNALGGLRILNIQPDGSAFMVLEEVVLDSAFMVDQTVRLYAADGTLKGQARVPLAAQYTYVENGVVASRTGEAYALITRQDRLEIQRLVLTRELPAIMPLIVENAAADVAPPTINACRSISDMAYSGNHFADFIRQYSDANVWGYCPGRVRPRWLNASYTPYTGVAYDWGGFDTVTSYDDLLYQGYQAGDINTTVESCSRGVDCSGFVSRAWGLTTKYSTYTLPNISWQLGARTSMVKGDILNCADSHVVMFDFFTSQGIFVWEATTYNGADRVKHWDQPWSRFGSCYVPRRYNNKC